ncbi:hypothetical protein DXG03_008931 [Asterophora parasitica]|uniref:Exocyst complex component Sec3 PIP2-binding N-terminal domain-containing protein n=1 Tax=Asterophora parasitica TaxID=117018 RepID=A0A9P7KEH3_9AGAR|nr:hypothetical protein DXG03_008931 [Asterophora parasitica]
MADQRQKIIASVFSRRNATGNLEETYVSHVKIWEDAGPEGGGRKPRYILLSQANNGSGFIHKSKLNTNGSFSVGKTWRLPELRAVQVVNPLSFNITLSRTYRWQTENQVDQSSFLEALVQLFHTVAPGSALQLEGFPDTQRVTVDRPDSRATGNLRARTPSQIDRDNERLPSPTPQSHLRAGSSSRAASPTTIRSYSTTASNPTPTNRPPSIKVQSQQIGSRPKLSQPLNAEPMNHSAPSINLLSTSRPAPHKDASQDAYRTSGRPLPLESPAPYPSSPHRSRPPSPSIPRKQSSRSVIPTASDGPPFRRDQNTRISFYDPANQAALDRLISGGSNIHTDGEGDDESALATMTNVEEMIEGYEWASDDVITRKSSRGAADLIEARLLDELMALEKANIHSFLESDDRIGIVLKYLDEAVSELDNMDSLVSSYKIHLNTVSDDILFIQSQNRGLQVQTQNQRALLGELENLLQTVNVDQRFLVTLTQESLEKPQSLQRLEEAAAQLYKALQAGRDTGTYLFLLEFSRILTALLPDMAATMERLQEYRTHNVQFCKRIMDFLSIMFTAQSTLLLDTNGINSRKGSRPTLVAHEEMESYLGRYSGLMLYLKEMDENVYAKLCAAYFSAASGLHGAQMKTMFSTYINFVKKASEEAHEHSFSSTPTTAVYKGASGIRRAGTIIRSPIEGRQKEKDKSPDGDLRASEAFGLVLEQLAPAIYRENEFITDFLQINDAGLTFADYMGLDNYFRRQATRAAGLSQTTVKLVRGAMDLIFGFLPAEMKAWLDGALSKDSMEIIGIIACLERFLDDAEDRGSQSLLPILEKQHSRLKGIFERHVKQQITDIEQTKLSSKKRQGVAHFVKHFPTYVGRVENQLIGADGLEIRVGVDTAYEKIVQSIFDSLKQMAKMDGEGEDKGQLNYHVILIENMHHFVAETSLLEVGSINVFCRRAEAIYDENLSAYIKIVLRRPFARIIDYFEGVERLLKTTAPTEVSNNSIYSKSALRKVVREYSSKDLRKHVDALFARVQKHFADASGKTTTEESGGIVPGTVLVGIWKACEEELLRITDLFAKRISQCYSNTSILLEYTAADIEAAFRRHRVGS